jgi:alkylation response protein AidB-like acyl-CoA dehydrogenase
MNFFDKTTIHSIRSHSAKADELKKIPKEWLKLIYAKKYFKLFVPEQDGGLMMPLPQALHLFDQAAFIDGNFGWAITIGSGGGYFYSYMQPDTAKKVFKGTHSVIAGGGKPARQVQKVKGGYKVTGHWQYASGASYATSFTANAQLEKNKVLAVTFDAKQVSIKEDWNAIGMKATESNSFSTENAFVANEMVFDLASTKLFYEHPFYHYPFLQFAETSFAALSLGLCRHFFDEVNTLLKENKKNWSVIKGRYEFVKSLVAKKESEFNKTSNQFYKIADASWEEILKNGKLSSKTQKQVSDVSKRSSRVVLNCMDTIIQYMGMGAVMENSSINKIWKDAHTACQHVLLIPYNEI